jgi:hypothetical protein
MAEHSLTKFKSKLIGGGARPNLFEVEFTNANGGQGGGLPSGITKLDTDKFEYLCKAANLPASNVASIDVPFRGRTFKVAGDRTFDTWTITIINDTDFKIRQTMEEWCQKVANYQEASGATNPADYMGNATVIQLGRKKSNIGNGATNSEGEGLKGIAQYKFVDIFPTTFLQLTFLMIPLTLLKNSQLSSQVNYWYPEGTPTK